MTSQQKVILIVLALINGLCFCCGLTYTAHEMSNPEYWYGSMSFGFVFVGVTAIAALYLSRRNVLVIWLGDGLGRFLSRL